MSGSTPLDPEPVARTAAQLAVLQAEPGGAILPWLPVDRVLGTGVAACLGFFGYGWYGPWVAHVSESCPPDQVGLAIGAAMAVNQIAIVAAPSLLGLISDLCSYRVMWWMLAAALFALTGVVRTRLARPGANSPGGGAL